MRQKIVGYQLHHSVALEDAVRGMVNARAGLSSAITRTGDNDLIGLAWSLDELTREIIKAKDAAGERLRSMPPEEVIDCREGRKPWPDELSEGFEPRCTCDDFCQIHQGGRTEEGWECQCLPCPAHGEMND